MTQQIATLDELRKAERNLVEAINGSRNGGARFLAHPLAMLSAMDAGLSPELEELLVALLPQLGHATRVGYQAMTDAEEEGPVTVRIQSLFAWDDLERRRHALSGRVES
jgi:hypothetical protein